MKKIILLITIVFCGCTLSVKEDKPMVVTDISKNNGEYDYRVTYRSKGSFTEFHYYTNDNSMSVGDTIRIVFK